MKDNEGLPEPFMNQEQQPVKSVVSARNSGDIL